MFYLWYFWFACAVSLYFLRKTFLPLLMVLTVTFLEAPDNFSPKFFPFHWCHLIKRASFSSSTRAGRHIECFFIACVRDQKQKCHQTAGEPVWRKETKNGGRRRRASWQRVCFQFAHAGEKTARRLYAWAPGRVHAAPSITSHREIKPSIFCHKPIQYLSGRRFFPPVCDLRVCDKWRLINHERHPRAPKKRYQRVVCGGRACDATWIHLGGSQISLYFGTSLFLPSVGGFFFPGRMCVCFKFRLF